MKCLLIGYGNVGRGDDALGPLVVENVAEASGCANIDLKVMSLFQLDIALCNELKSADLAIFVDARADESEDPLIVRKEIPDPLKTMAAHSSHTCSINGLLNLTVNLYGKIPQCYSVLPKAYDFDFGEGLSSRARDSAILAENRIKELLQECSGQQNAMTGRS
jgi:hydrogenase maturation protease